ncbi:ABC transporter ATP-binding protein [Microbacterium luteum]|uniref:ABC transporter ATP-binding protein n=1 Tax=Microbacterium luteum TaxID=2782167 RepID=UPI001E53A964|nr:ABC transporter ATP-binding protein [Microbacterium luteum]
MSTPAPETDALIIPPRPPMPTAPMDDTVEAEKDLAVPEADPVVDEDDIDDLLDEDETDELLDEDRDDLPDEDEIELLDDPVAGEHTLVGDEPASLDDIEDESDEEDSDEDGTDEEESVADKSDDDTDVEGSAGAEDPLVDDEDDVATDDVDPDVVDSDPVAADLIDPDPVEADAPATGAAAVTDIVSSVMAEDEPASDAALALRGVTKVFGQTRAVDGIDLTVPAGTFYGLVGPNGAGKTTTLSMIAGLLRPDRGEISVNGVDAVTDAVRAKSMMGVLPDRLRTFDRLTGRQLLYYYGVLRGLSPSVVESRTADLARAFDLTDALGRVVSDYSVGMSKKVMLAGALIHSPRVLVLDEPFESVDPVSSSVILDILGTYVDHGGTVILSSHGMDLVERVCSRVAVIVAGQVLAEGTIDEVRGELTLEQRFVELAGGLSDVEGLEWLHTFSD